MAESAQTCPILTPASNKLLVINVLQMEPGKSQQINFQPVTQQLPLYYCPNTHEASADSPPMYRGSQNIG
jgi:hypothetical protein